MKKWIDTLEQHLIKWLLGLFTTSILVAVGFYFDATHIMAQNTKDIKEVSSKFDKIDNAPSLNTLKINQVKTEISEQKENIKTIQKDLKEFQKKYDKDKDKIIELLFEIKQKIKE